MRGEATSMRGERTSTRRERTYTCGARTSMHGERTRVHGDGVAHAVIRPAHREDWACSWPVRAAYLVPSGCSQFFTSP